MVKDKIWNNEIFIQQLYIVLPSRPGESTTITPALAAELFFFSFYKRKKILKNLKYKTWCFGTTNFNLIEASICHISVQHFRLFFMRNKYILCNRYILNQCSLVNRLIFENPQWGLQHPRPQLLYTFALRTNLTSWTLYCFARPAILYQHWISVLENCLCLRTSGILISL